MSEHSKYCAWMTRPKYWRQSLSEVRLKVRKLCHLFAFKLTKQYQKPNSLWSNSGLDFSAFYKQDKALFFGSVRSSRSQKSKCPFARLSVWFKFDLPHSGLLRSLSALSLSSLTCTLLTVQMEPGWWSWTVNNSIKTSDLCQRRTLYSEAQERNRLW